MHIRKTLSIVALALGLSLTASADTSTKGGAGKGKPGDSCKVNADCDQSGRSQSCISSKCQLDPIPPPPT